MYTFFIQYRTFVCGTDTSIEPFLVYSIDSGVTYTSISLWDVVEAVGLDCTTNTALLSGMSLTTDNMYLRLAVGKGIVFLAISDVIKGLIEPAYVIYAGETVLLSSATVNTTTVAAGTDGAVVRVTNTNAITSYEPITANALYATAVYDSNYFAVGGASGTVLYGDKLALEDVSISTVDDVIAIAMTNATTILAATASTLYISYNAGKSWKAQRVFNGGEIAGIAMATSVIGYLAFNNTTKQLPIVYKTVDGGHMWLELPYSSDIPAGAVCTKIVTSAAEANAFIATGYVPLVYPANPSDPLKEYDPTVLEAGFTIIGVY
jgi:hypothetical protein